MKNKILVVYEDNSFMELFRNIGIPKPTENIMDLLTNPKQYCLVVFTGGADVDPALYNDKSPKGLCSYRSKRDLIEKHVFEKALKNNIPMTGVCRGIQFLNVMCGGRLMHHISGHGNGIHRIITKQSDIIVNSLHHQMVVPNNKVKVCGITARKRSHKYIGKNDEEENYCGEEVEAVYMPKIKGCGVQYHPEMMFDETDGRQFYLQFVSDLLSKDEKYMNSEYVL